MKPSGKRLLGDLVTPVALAILTGLIGVPLSARRGPVDKYGKRHDADRADYLAPVAVAPFDNDRLLVLGSVGQRLVVLDRPTGKKLRMIPLPAPGSGLVVGSDMAYVTTTEPRGRVLEVNPEGGVIRRQWQVGHTPMSPLLSPDGRTLYLANRFDNAVGFLHLSNGQVQTVKVIREPVALALSPDGKHLFVANHLPQVRAFPDEENPYIAAEVSVIDTETPGLIRHIELPNGSQNLRGIAVSPDGRYVAVTHVLGHYVRPTTHIERGAMNVNALSLLDARTLVWMDTVLLDDPNLGAANPWALAWSGDGRQLYVTHAGTQELSVIDSNALLQALAAKPGATGLFAEQDLQTMKEIRRRLPLPVNGARALCQTHGVVYVAGFFSDNLALVDLNPVTPTVRSLTRETPADQPLTRLGEQIFNDARLCFQQWQSCATCHPDGRSDTLYWDLLNDGIGNTKNTKSLLMSMLTPPAMWRGVRADAALAVQAGFHHIELAEPTGKQIAAVKAYLFSMKETPSPYLDARQLETPKTEDASCGKCHVPGVLRGRLTPAARRGKVLFEGKARCASCHPHPTFTSGQQVDPGLGSGVSYDVPSLIEVWRTAPYLHNGDALTLRQAITDFNFMQKRGRTQDLTEQELNDLLAYLRSL